MLRPIQQRWPDNLSITPYAVLLKPAQGRAILTGTSGGGFSDQAGYIVLKQLEEADVIVINRIDELSVDEVNALEQLLQAKYPDTQVLKISARTGQGFASLIERLNQTGSFGQKLMDIDYDSYAAGEAELGWLNGQLTITAALPINVNDLLLSFLNELRAALKLGQQEPAHLKVIGQSNGCFGVANVVASTTPAELSVPSRCSTQRLDLIVNARVACDPLELEELVRKAMLAVCRHFDAQALFLETKRFRPGRPTPMFRILSP